MDRSNQRRATILVCALLGGIILAVYWPVFHHDFIIYDDHQYITENPHVLGGLTWENLKWALTSGYASNWHPLTWLSHILDIQVFGLRPGWHHLVNVAFHVANSLLLFLVLKRMTRALWRSAFVAALFALHPLHVESVAWAAERKDVLSTFFFMLTLGAYARYVEARVKCQVSGVRSQVPSLKSQVPGPKTPTSGREGNLPLANVAGQGPECGELEVHRGRGTPQPADHASRFTFHVSRFTHRASRFYFLALSFFALGLMCKPMLVTLPFVLLLLDYWPLGRWRIGARGDARPPDNTQPPENLRPSETVWGLLREKFPFFALSAASSVVTFIAQKSGGSMAGLDVWPLATRLANASVAYVEYLVKLSWPAKMVLLYLAPAKWPAWQVAASLVVLAGVTMLVFGPGRRHGYLPVGWLWFIGTLVPVIGLVQVGNQFMADRYTYIPLIGCFIILVWGAWNLASKFRIASRALPVAACLLLLALCVSTRLQLNLWRNSETVLTHCLVVTKDNFIAQNNLAAALDAEGRSDEAKAHFLAALRIRPRDAGMLHNLGVVLARKGDYTGAAPYLEEAVKLDPKLATVYLKLGSLTDKAGNTEQAIAYYREGVRLNPDQADACNNLAWMLATCPDSKLRNGTEAVGWAEIGCAMTGYTQTVYIGTLAAAYAEAGRFQEAVTTAEKAIALATASGDKALAQRNQELLALYREQKAYREPAQPAGAK